MDVTIQINNPPLQVGESFKVKYRLLPNGAFSVEQLEDNDPFTLTGLAAGEYELSVILDKGDTDCPEVLKKFTVVEPFTCVVFAAEVQQKSNGLYVLHITYPTIVTQPPCGWKVIIIGSLNNKTVLYPTLGASPLDIPVLNEAMTVKVVADLCNGKTQNCFEGDLSAAAAACDPLALIDTSVTYLNNPLFPDRFRINVFFTQSVPYTSQLQITVNQTNTVTSGIPGKVSFDAFNPVLLTPTQTSFVIFIDVNPNVGGVTTYTFDYMIIDFCNNKLTGTMSVPVP